MKITIHIEYDDSGFSKDSLYDVPENISEEAFGKTLQELAWRAYESTRKHQPADCR